MKEIKFYRTYSQTPKNQMERRDFETIEHAKVDAIKDLVNTNFGLFEIQMIFDGVITETSKYLGPITCGKNIQNFELREISKKI